MFSCIRPLHELEMLWLKDDILIENSGISYTFKDAWNRTLSLVSANLTHTGQYTCQVRLRSGGFPTVTASATVTVLGECIVLVGVVVITMTAAVVVVVSVVVEVVAAAVVVLVVAAAVVVLVVVVLVIVVVEIVVVTVVVVVVLVTVEVVEIVVVIVVVAIIIIFTREIGIRQQVPNSMTDIQVR
jgi:hypothetical protein